MNNIKEVIDEELLAAVTPTAPIRKYSDNLADKKINKCSLGLKK